MFTESAAAGVPAMPAMPGDFRTQGLQAEADGPASGGEKWLMLAFDIWVVALSDEPGTPVHVPFTVRS